MTTVIEADRRRHARVAVDVGPVELRHGPRQVVVAAPDVRDVGVGGCFLLLDDPPGLGSSVVVGFAGFVFSGFVVRVQRGGREKGQPVRPGIAVAFAGVDEATLLALQATVSPA